MEQNKEEYELPDHLVPILKKARKLEWITLAYLSTVVALMYVTMGSSQAMKTAWLEDALSLLPATAFLIASGIYDKPRNKTFQYGYHRVFSIAFLTGSVALFGMGAYLCIDSSISLIHGERPTIGTMVFFGEQLWMGWVMILVLIYSSLPAMLLGLRKMPLAKKLHNKILFADAKAQKADYMTAFAAIIGILGVGAGLWWADATTALIISISVIKDGFQHLSSAIEDLMDRQPVRVSDRKKDQLVDEIAHEVASWDWVRDSEVRFRENGQVYFGEVYIIPMQDTVFGSQFEEGVSHIKALHWKIHDVTIMPVSSLKSLRF
ncbi:cation diffusion facilitator family transporter [Flagellimonas baculiformis]|uniref:cation diffusion facilitator family transporter n=1 Tax=Flagellimonas baculiformis TaxID=3067310 RepID=UPI00296FF4A3|nr:cation transporter [Muricauda sp. D6]